MSLRTSAPKAAGEQGRLWDWVGDRDLGSVAQKRPHVGDFFEEAARVLFSATRHQIDSTADYCPDVSVAAERFMECKAIGATGQGMVFADRVAKDARLVDGGATLTYLFWRHGVQVEDFTTLHALRTALAQGVRDVLAVPFERLRRAVRGLKLVCLLTTDRGNRMGYRLPKGLIEELAGSRVSVELPRAKVYGCDLRPLTLTTSDPGRCFPDPTMAERAAAGQLLYELSQQRLEVGLSEAPEQRSHRGQMVRMVMNRNPTWYRKLCDKHTCARGARAKDPMAKRRASLKRRGHRKHDTSIKRPQIEAALQRLSDGNPPNHTNDFRVLPIVRAAAAC